MPLCDKFSDNFLVSLCDKFSDNFLVSLCLELRITVLPLVL